MSGPAPAGDATRQEARRLARLRKLAVMDTAHEPLFDALTRVASRICGTPIALVSLLDDRRQWFKANIGLEGVSETPRDIAFCDHAIRAEGVMEVADAMADARFAANPLVTGDPNIRFYAGAPIVMPEGERIGTLCVIDRQERHLTQLQRDSLGDLAGVAAEVLLMREQAIREQHERNSFRDRAERIAGVGGWELDLRTREVKWTDQNCRIFELEPGHVPTYDEHLKYYDERGRRLIEETANEAIRTGKPWDIELPMVTARGRAIWTRSIGLVEYEGGKPVRLVGALQDVTDRKAAEEELRRAADITTATLESTADGIVVASEAREVLLYNRRLQEMLGLPHKIDLTKSAGLIRHSLLQLKDQPAFQAKLQETYRTNSESFDVLEFRDGRILEAYSRPYTLGKDQNVRVWSFRDVTQRKAAEAELQKAKDAAETANQAKSQFLATMSHEIRTPLNGIVGITRLLLDETLSPRQQQLAQLIDSSAQSLMVLVNDFLDLAKIEAGRTELEDVPFSLKLMLDELSELFGYRASARSLLFRCDVAQGTPDWIQGDPARLRQILNNLLSNALKFTHQGEVALSVAPEGDGLRFTVSDTGIGIPPDVLPRLFDRFVQADASTTRKYGGTGLGLAIVAQLGRLMGGRIEPESTPGKGSSFSLVLPGVRRAAPPAAVPVNTQAAKGNRAARLLLVEDNPTNQIVAMGLLNKIGYSSVTVVSDGQQAVDAAMDGSFAAILMDCQMPVMDGYEASRTLRARSVATPIIALTANAAPSDAQECLAAGMNDYLSKPINLAALEAALERWVPQQEAGAPPRDAAHAPAGSSAGPPAFDRELALERLGGDAALLDAVIASFVAHAGPSLQALRESLSAGDMDTAHRHIHSMTGSAGAVGAAAVHQWLGRMDAHVKAGESAPAQAMLAGLEDALARFHAASSLPA